MLSPLTRMLLITCCFLSVNDKAFAQPAAPQPFREIHIDISGETDEPELLDKTQWQTEAGFIYNYYKNGPPSAIEQLAVRYGVTSFLELGVLVEEGSQRDRYMDETVQSTYPLSAGGKLLILKDHKWLPDMAIISFVKLPFTAHTKAEEIHWSAMGAFAIEHTFGKWKLGYAPGIQQQLASADIAETISVSLHYKLMQQLEIFTDYFAQYEHGTEPQHNADAGITYQFSNHIAGFLYAGSSINAPEYNRFLNMGIAILP